MFNFVLKFFWQKYMKSAKIDIIFSVYISFLTFCFYLLYVLIEWEISYANVIKRYNYFS